jgi:hypothetical protein
MLSLNLNDGFEFLEVELLRDDLRFGLAKGDVCIASPNLIDPEKLDVEWREKDSYAPLCKVYRDEVKILRFPSIDNRK